MSMISNVPESHDPQELARRLTILEREVDRLKKRRTTANAGKKWWHAVAGTFDADPVYEAIAAEGRMWRQSQRRAARPSRKQNKGGAGGAHP
jgi:hypothetical protein